MWEKNNTFQILNKTKFNISHNSIPTPILLNNKVKVLFSTRCEDNINRIMSCNLDTSLNDVIDVEQYPIFSNGELGTFDCNGVMASSLVNLDDKNIFMYYIGWNKQVDVSYRLSIGLAISEDSGKTFNRFSKGPLLDRRIEEPFFNTAPCVVKEGNTWKMWYVSCTGWEIINNHPEPKYRIAYRESNDGIIWSKNSSVCIDYDYDKGIESIGRPYVVKLKDRYYMNCSVRKITDYRNNPKNSYTIYFYESIDGVNWTFTGEQVNKDLKNFDNEMTCYGSFLINSDSLYCIYNGNGFGKTGFGVLKKKI